MQKNRLARAIAFTGHMIDLPGRTVPRFPPEAETDAARAIAKAVKRQASKRTIGFASAARGGDILFHEVAREAGVQTVIILPFGPEKFVETSVAGVSNGKWVERFWDLWNATPTGGRIVLNLDEGDAAYAACNEKTLSLAGEHGTFRLIALWDGKDDGGLGGTAHMIETAKTENAHIDVIAMRGGEIVAA